MPVIYVMIVNSLEFLQDLAAWLITPVPLTFSVLFILAYLFRIVRGLLNV